MFPVSMDAVDVYTEVFPMRQEKSAACWAVAYTMMLSWQNRQSMTVEAAMDSLAWYWRAMYEVNRGIDDDRTQSFTRDTGLTEEGPASYSPHEWARMVDAHGPLLVRIDGGRDGDRWTHFVVVTAVRGNGTADGTTVTFADPATGTADPVPFTKFTERIEGKDNVRGHKTAYIYHF